MKRFAYIAVGLTIIFACVVCLPKEAAAASAEETIINHYREIIKKSEDPAKLADAHYEVGLALEKLDRKTEATAEYLKIIINYPDVKEVNEKAEARLADLYHGFSARSGEFEEAREEEDKAPTIFFAYVKGLYENYRDLGQYDKALKILEKLYDLDPENQGYLIDMGNIHLDGYNNADKAVLHFRKSLEQAPNNPKAYIDLGRAHEKKGDYEGALRTYNEAAKLFPASPWTMYGLKRTEGIRLAKDKRLIKDWWLLGPFDNSDKKGLGKVFPPEERINIKAAYAGKNGSSIRWSRPFNYDDSGYVDLNALIDPHDYAVAYALTYVNAPGKRKVNFRMGSDSGVRAWLNDEEVWSQDIERSAEVDDDIITVTLNKGWNKILLKIPETCGAWGFYFRVTDLKGHPQEDLVFDPLKNDNRLREIYSRIKKKKRLRITGMALLYTGAFSVFLIGLIFMVSNILNRIKINRMKEDFISSVSHELKTPISAIKMFAETLKRGKVKEDPRKNEYCDMIIGESDRLTRFINKILDFSKLEKGGGIFEFKKTDLAGLAKRASEIYKDEMQDEALLIKVNAGKEPIFAEADKDAVLQALLNLIDNAYKYSGKTKEISVNVSASRGKAFLEVADKGSGIPKPEIDKIFDKFYRIEGPLAGGAKGSGLGLAFVKSVIEAHGGRITVDSKPGAGSKFTITLPVIGG
jgi:signal transduction histidine kinase/tetratricopeptide (TPR) repeat protein